METAGDIAVSVEEIVDKLREALTEPSCTAVGLTREEATEIVKYFDDIDAFKKSLG